ncbi:hypothetical protein FG386_001502 [Cryptosporidium ryanae]|uniref:uncharacterized protein n=1 Tax=Cryptosporidium ryanae TaxID=515981 RepID=UPI00351A320F|nr:hypothetical protein FG386_001502 [Cryptosporidium ryanae]
MHVLNETNLSVVTTSTSNFEYGMCSNSNEIKAKKLDNKNAGYDFYSNKENVNEDMNELNNNEYINYIQDNNECNNDVDNIMSENDNINVNTESYSDLDDDSDLGIVENNVKEQIAMMIPDLDSTLKLKHDTERFYMTLSIAEAELDLAKSASRVGNFNHEEFKNKHVDTNCLNEIRGYVEELLDTINESKNVSFNMQKIIEECYDILRSSISFNNLTTLNTMDIGGIHNVNYANAEKLKALCEIITDENSSLKKRIRTLTKEEDNNLLFEHTSDSSVNSEFYNNDLTYYIRDNKSEYLNESDGYNDKSSNKSGWRYILMRFLVFLFLLVLFSPTELSNDIKSINKSLYNENISSNKISFKTVDKLEDKSEELINDIHNKLKKIRELGYYDQDDGFSICSIISEFDLFNSCFTKIRLT